MVEFRAFKNGVFSLVGRYEKRPDAVTEQKRQNRLTKISTILPVRSKAGEKVYELWVKE